MHFTGCLETLGKMQVWFFFFFYHYWKQLLWLLLITFRDSSKSSKMTPKDILLPVFPSLLTDLGDSVYWNKGWSSRGALLYFYLPFIFLSRPGSPQSEDFPALSLKKSMVSSIFLVWSINILINLSLCILESPQIRVKIPVSLNLVWISFMWRSNFWTFLYVFLCCTSVQHLLDKLSPYLSVL